MTLKELLKPRTPPFDGGYSYWVTICGCLAQAVVLGVLNSYPVFENQLLADTSFSGGLSEMEASIGFAVSLGVAPIAGIVAGSLVQFFKSTRIVCLIGMLCMLFANTLTAAAGKHWTVLVFLYGLPMGFAVGCILTSTAAAATTYFNRRRTIGMGICFAGGGLGSCIVPPIAGLMTETLEWRQSFYIMNTWAVIGIFACLFIVERGVNDEKLVAALKHDGSRHTLVVKGNPKHPSLIKSGKNFDSTSKRGSSPLPQQEANADSQRLPNVPIRRVDSSSSSNNSETTAVLTNPLGGATDAERAGSGFSRRGSTASSKLPEMSTLDVHARLFGLKEWVLHIIPTKVFLALFFSGVLFYFSFFTSLYALVQISVLMGQPGSFYENEKPISSAVASRNFIAYGVVEALAGPFLGLIASTILGDRIIYTCSMIILALVTIAYIFSREQWHFLAVAGVIGLGVSGFFATFTSIIGQQYFGPNLPTIIGVLIASGFLGGFASTSFFNGVIKATPNMNATYVLVVLTCFYVGAGALVFFLVPNPPVRAEEDHVADPNKEEHHELNKYAQLSFYEAR